MIEKSFNDPITAWEDCYEIKPKRQILVAKARLEIQRAWVLWNGDKTSEVASKMIFFGWLRRHRPYFLTFRSKGDKWQTVHGWLVQLEADQQERLRVAK